MQTFPSFFEHPAVQLSTSQAAAIPVGIATVFNPEIGLGGAYGTWGQAYDNQALTGLVSRRLGRAVAAQEVMNLSELGFHCRHHTPDLSPQVCQALEIEVGTRFLQAALQANGWSPAEVSGVLIGVSSPVCGDYVERIAQGAGIPAEVLKVSLHKACDSSVAGLHLALNPQLAENRQAPFNLAEALAGKKVLVGGIEGLSRFVRNSCDLNALQLFGNAAGVIGIIPGQNMKFIAGQAHEVFDAEGVLQVRMDYPHSGQANAQGSLVEISQAGKHHLRLAGLMHPPQDGRAVVMAGPMGMVKLFVRTGVEVVRRLYAAYQAELARQGQPDRPISVGIVHHANLKINQLKAKHLQKEGIRIPMPWLLDEFGNVSAASNMIAFLRQLPLLRPAEVVLIDGFGAGTYYDALVVEMGG